ncbi:hypothetical protein Osc1_20130 [Hominimerdicola sp. 21CYCFAH17_S]
MKCTVCGTELGINEQFCSNCGTRKVEMPGISSSGLVFGSNPNAVNEAVPAVRTVKKSHKTLVSVIIILAIILGSAGYFYVRYFVSKTYKLDGFTVKLPISMEETDEGNAFSKLMNTNSLFDAKAEGYGNGYVGFAYVIIDYKDVDGLSAVTEEIFISLMDSVFDQQGQEYKKESLDGNVLKYTIVNSKGKKVYNYMTCVKKDAKYYLLDFQCLEKYKSIFASKIDEWVGTVSFDD